MYCCRYAIDLLLTSGFEVQITCPSSLIYVPSTLTVLISLPPTPTPSLTQHGAFEVTQAHFHLFTSEIHTTHLVYLFNEVLFINNDFPFDTDEQSDIIVEHCMSPTPI